MFIEDIGKINYLLFLINKFECYLNKFMNIIINNKKINLILEYNT